MPFRGGAERLDAELTLEPADRVPESGDELGLDRVLDDRVPVRVDATEMLGECAVVEGQRSTHI
jgi:hypothetical protein